MAREREREGGKDGGMWREIEEEKERVNGSIRVIGKIKNLGLRVKARHCYTGCICEQVHPLKASSRKKMAKSYSSGIPMILCDS